ncbi:MAG TPA: hypothetical protein VLI45_04910 [Acidobacteriaceae bacterium]|nr:hypothetical protein [Acidobacteriaceae bacterium]
MPPKTILLSQMMRELSTQPGFTQALIRELRGTSSGGKRGPSLLTPSLLNELRNRILGKDWSGLDRFPGWTMGEITPTVRVLGHFVGTPDSSQMSKSNPGGPTLSNGTQEFLDVGPYALGEARTISLDEPSPFAPFNENAAVTPLGYGVQRGDGANDLAPEHPESERLADALNRLAVNTLHGAAPFTVTLGAQSAATPQDFMRDLIGSGHDVTVIDARYFANFGHLHYKGDDVMMPFWINTRIAVPGTGGPFGIGARPLLVPVAHAEYEWRIRGPRINADVSYYFGIDGKSEWRVMDTLDQAWVLKRAAHTYTGAQAVEVTRLAGLLTIAYMRQHIARPHLPFSGYYTLGVCQDGVSAIEHRMTGKVTLFPNTVDTSLFNDPRDAEVNAMLRAIPKDRDGVAPEPERIFGSLPTTAGTDDSFSAITVPGLASDLRSAYSAWQRGTLRHTRRVWPYATVLILAAAGALFASSWKLRRKNL